MESGSMEEVTVAGGDGTKKGFSRLMSAFGCTQAPKDRTSPVDNPSSPSGNSDCSFCRICHEGESKGGLISPCYCTGSLGQVHMTCLEHWLSQCNSDICEICKYHFVTRRKQRAFTEWLRHPSSPSDLRNLIGDIICLMLLMPLSILSSYLCCLGAYYYMPHQQMEAAGLIALSTSLICVFIIWCFVTARYHWKTWKSWQLKNQEVHLVVSEADYDCGDRIPENCVNHAPPMMETSAEDLTVTVL